MAGRKVVCCLLFLFSFGFSETLEEVLSFAVENSPTLKALQAERLLIEGKRLSYRSNLNPELSVEFGNFSTSKESYTKSPLYHIGYNQPLPLYGILKKADSLYRVEEKAFKYRFEAQKRQLMAEIYRLFYRALYKKELLELSKEALNFQKELFNFVERSYRLGEASKLEFLKAKREYQMAVSSFELAKAEYEASLKELSSLVGKDIKDVEGSCQIPHLKELMETPLLSYYEEINKAIGKELQIEKALSMPQMSVSLVAEKVADREYGLRVGISSTLPFFYKRQAEVLNLLSKREVLMAEKENYLRRLEYEVKAIKLKLEEIKKQLDKIDTELLPEAKQELELALKSYRLRVITLPELYLTRQSYQELLKKRLELLLMAHEEKAKYVELGGLP